MEKRAVIVTLCLVIGALAIARASRTEQVPPRESLATFPLDVGAWRGQPQPPFDDQVLAELRVDEYVNRVYYAGNGASAVGLYIGYYKSQRQTQTMHSPLNCLPGAGWQPAKKERVAIAVPAGSSGSQRPVVVNRFTIQKGLDRQVVLYWYQSHGRVEASEYWGKVFTVIDAIRLNRTDAAMVRIIAPVQGSDAGAEAAAERLSMEFARALFPLLGRYLPA